MRLRGHTYSQSCGTHSRSPRWQQELNNVGHHCHLPWLALTGSWRQVPELGIEPRDFNTECLRLKMTCIHLIE